MDNYSSTLSLIAALLIGLLVSVAYFWWDTAAGRSDLDVPGGDQRRATAFGKVFVGVVILFLTVGGGLLLGSLLAPVISHCESWECIPAMGIGAVLGAVIGLLLGVTVLIGKYSGRARQPNSADSVKVEDAVAVEVRPAQPATVSDVVLAVVFCVLMVAFVMLAVWAST